MENQRFKRPSRMKLGLKIAFLLTAAALSYVYLPQACSQAAPDPRIDSLTQANDSLKVQFTLLLSQDNAKHAQDSVAARKFETVHRQDSLKIAELKARPTVIQVRKEFPVIDTLILTYDTAVTRLETRVQDLRTERVGERHRFNTLLLNSETRNKNLAGINSSLQLSNAELVKRNKRLKHWNTVWKIATAGAIGWRLSK